jgi:hypothetical protein
LATIFFQRIEICPPAALDYLVLSRADGVSHSPGGVADSFCGIGSAPEWRKQAGVKGSVSLYYGRSRVSQMFAGLVLQFSMLHFYFSRTGEKKPKNNKGKTAF